MQPLLSKLKSGIENKVENITSAGVWNPRGAGELDAVSESLDIIRIDARYFDIDCVPAMWARPLLFEMALYEERHLLYKRILGEWRGLLAMLALIELRPIPLKVMNVQLLPDPKLPKDVTGFVETLKSLAPLTSLSSSDTLWTNLHVILFGDEAIGMTSPTTLVCTAADYYNRISNVSWFDGRFLLDPTSHLGSLEKKALASWLNQLAENLRTHRGLDQGDSKWDKLLKLLNDFQRDLGGAPAQPALIIQSKLGMNIGIFRYLDRPVKGTSEGQILASYVKLKPSRKNAPATSLIVVDREIAEQWNILPQEILVYEPMTIASCPFDDLGGSHGQIGTVILEGMEWRLSEEFFTEKLFVIDQQDAFPGAMKPKGSANLQHLGSPVTPIIPIKSEILDYLEVDDLSKRIIFEQDDEGITVKLRLPLAGLDNGNWEFEIKREFRLDKGDIVSIPNVPILEIWPNFKVPDWSLYYTYFSAPNKTFYAEPYVPSDKPTQEDIQTDVHGSDNIRGIDSQITRTKTLPEAMRCEYVVADELGTMNQLECGMLLISQPKLSLKPIGSWSIGIDFGTTGTNVCVNDKGEGKEPDLITFKQRFLRVTESEESVRTSLYDKFLPGNEHVTPFLSIFHDFEKRTNPPLRPLLDGHVFFLFANEKFDAFAPGIAVDLKWSSDPSVRSRTQAFLEQICLQCSAEAAANGVGKISWRFSYPTAFSKETLQDFRRIWADITESSYSSTGISQIDAVPIDIPESIVSAFYFAESSKVKATFGTGAVCIDIGGGTSDISIWDGKNLCWQTSLRFAGRDIFLEPLRKKPDFLSIFQVETVKLANSANDPKRFYAQADAIITNKGNGGDEWLKNLKLHAGDEKIRGFVRLIAIGLSGLYYYIGLMLQSLSKSGKYKSKMPNVYVAGNGARLFHWLASGRYEGRSPINKLFKDILLNSTGFREEARMFEISISPSPKSEAAFGLVCDGKILHYGDKEIGEIEDQIVQMRYEVLAGEVFTQNGVSHDWSEMITAKQLSNGLNVKPGLERLNDFIQTFDKYAKSPDTVVMPINADDVLIHQIFQDISTSLIGLKDVDEEAISVEPLFITELRDLLSKQTDKWVSDNP